MDTKYQHWKLFGFLWNDSKLLAGYLQIYNIIKKREIRVFVEG